MGDTDFVSHLLPNNKVMLEVTLTSEKDQIRDWLMENLWFPFGRALQAQKRRKIRGKRPKKLLKSEIPQIGVRIFWRNCHKPETWTPKDDNQMNTIVFSNMRKILIVQVNQMSQSSKSLYTALQSEHVIKIGHNFGPQLERLFRKRPLNKKVSKVREAYSFLEYAYRLDNGVQSAPEIFQRVDFYEAASKILGLQWSKIDDSVTAEFGNQRLSLEAIAYLCRKTFPLLPFYMSFFKITRRKAFAMAKFLEEYACIRDEHNACIQEADDRPLNIMKNYNKDKNDYSDGWDEEDVLQELEVQRWKEMKKLERFNKSKKKKATMRKEFIKKIQLDIYKKRWVPGGPKNRYFQASQNTVKDNFGRKYSKQR
eukprot:TRINITY_DN813_c0_g1_i3.p1 TRINITY_DN813_c0_g1~~TRINITY_DN813_c0_g1_i3.p1  ORF type:complete len:367 (-),score=54.61 TRINITY_DN813_c0_g1_i3:137-1237(-)